MSRWSIYFYIYTNRLTRFVKIILENNIVQTKNKVWKKEKLVNIIFIAFVDIFANFSFLWNCINIILPLELCFNNVLYIYAIKVIKVTYMSREHVWCNAFF